MSYRFFSLPAFHLETSSGISREYLLEAPVTSNAEVFQRALSGIEFRHERARDRIQLLLAQDSAYEHLGEEMGRSAIFARPPVDLPALLRMANQLEDFVLHEEGERAYVWRCDCGKSYAVPATLVRNVAIVCEGCQKPLSLQLGTSSGEQALLDPFVGSVNAFRTQLAAFFKESMARGWPVLVGQVLL